jgi:hypothetical protein
MSMGLLLGFATLYYLWRPALSPFDGPPEKESAAAARMRKEAARSNVNLVGIFASLYWITQATGYIYPGSHGTDVPEKDFPWAQLYLESVLLTLTSLGCWLEHGTLA